MKVYEIFKVCGIESLKYVWEFCTLVCYCGDISMPQNVTLNEQTVIGCLTCRSNGLMGGPWPKKAAMDSRPPAVSLKVWLRETTSQGTSKGTYIHTYIHAYINKNEDVFGQKVLAAKMSAEATSSANKNWHEWHFVDIFGNFLFCFIQFDNIAFL